MNAKNFDIASVMAMAHSPIRNYVAPGLTSSLIGLPSPKGTVRLFECERDQLEHITPHSHRYNFQAWVLAGMVRNVLWERSFSDSADLYRESEMEYGGVQGEYQCRAGGIFRYARSETVYAAGDCYSMRARDIHSIYFSRGAKVLVFEGENFKRTSTILEPVADGEVVPTFRTEPWMFLSVLPNNRLDGACKVAKDEDQ